MVSGAVARRPIVTDSVHVKKRVYFQQISDVLQIPIDEIRILNPQYRKDYIPGDIKPYPLVLPSFQIYSYIMSEDSIVAHNATKYARRAVVEPSTGSKVTREEGDYIITETVKYHKIKRGDTFNKIARKYGVTVNSIKKANKKVKNLIAGKTLKIVTTERTPKPREEVIVPEPADVINQNEINTTDSITGIDGEEIDTDSIMMQAIANAASPDSIRNNNPAPEEVVEEMNENVEETTVEKPAAPAADKTTTNVSNTKPKTEQPVYHTVRSGDSVAKIAKRYGTTTNKVLRLNGLTAKSKIHPGDKLRVK